MRVLVTGASGLLGQALLRMAPAHVEMVASMRTSRLPGTSPLQADLAEPGEARRLLRAARPEAVLHAAAWSNVQRCELEPEDALRINARAPAELASACREAGVPLVHCSTDYVFDGRAPDGYYEDAIRNPLQAYGRSKAEAEDAVLAEGGMVARLPLLLGPPAASGVQWWLGAAAAVLRGEEVAADDTEVRQPAWTNDVASALWSLTLVPVTGVLHAVPNETVTKRRLLRMLADECGRCARLVDPAPPGPGSAARPRAATLLRGRPSQSVPEIRDVSHLVRTVLREAVARFMQQV